MNERIKELALEAFQPINDIASEGIADRHTFNQAWFQLYNQKFAQLIVQDCVTKIAMIGISNFENDDISWTVEKAIEDIREHFGVKE